MWDGAAAQILRVSSTTLVDSGRYIFFRGVCGFDGRHFDVLTVLVGVWLRSTFTLALQFFFIEVDIILFNVDDGLFEEAVSLADKDGGNLFCISACRLAEDPDPLTSEVQLARAMASLSRIMLSN